MTRSTMWGLTESALYRHFADRFGLTRAQVRAIFAELERLAANELRRTGEFVIPGISKLVVQQRAPRIGRHPWTGAPITIPAKIALKVRVKKRFKDSVM